MSPPAGWSAETPDEQLVGAARNGDRSALELLLRRHHDRIHLLCRRMCRHRQDAEDATQLALVAIVRGLPGFDGRAAFSTWSHRVATNACLDELRRRARRPVPVDQDDEHEQHGAVDGGPAASMTDPEHAALGAEVRGDLQRALDLLPDEFRLPVVLRDVAEWDYAEIAQHLDLPPGTVRSRIARGRAKLAQLLSDPGDGNHPVRPDVGAQDAP